MEALTDATNGARFLHVAARRELDENEARAVVLAVLSLGDEVRALRLQLAENRAVSRAIR